MPAKKRKIFVLDTNVILHDSSCIYQFTDHDVIIPITVLEELDQFKKGNETINFHARDFVRTLDSFSEEKLFNGGFKIGPNNGKIIVKLEQEFHQDLVHSFSPGKPDHHILNIAYHAVSEHPKQNVMLITKDVNLRMKAKSLGLMAKDYTSDHVKDIKGLYTGRRIDDQVEEEIVDSMYKAPNEIPIEKYDQDKELNPNEFLIIKCGKKSALATHDLSKNLR